MKGPVIFDREDGSISFNLPEDALDYSGRLGRYLQEMFAYESMTASTVREMNSAAVKWLESNGVRADWDFLKENADDS